ncbi:MAG TPA: hypothetical protein VI461_00460, partial [Chitinophagaceae bacterium]|nr:hypothetical protein [Chitinophagaceae bacterium]
FIIYDSVIAATTYIDKTIIPEWCWFSSDTAFLRERANQYTRYNDSITGYTVSQKDNRIIVDFIVTTKASRLVYKVKFILSGNKLFELFGHFDPVDVENIYDRIFAGFKAERPGVRIDWSQTKINELARVLQNANLEETMLVRLWWNSLEFSKNDLPVLQTMLFKLYPDFDSGYNSDLNSLLLFKIESLDSLHTTVDYIKKNYSSITQENEYVKHFLVSYLAGITTAESYAVLKDALKNNSFNITTPVYLYGLYDSLELTATLFPDLLKYADSEALGSSVQSITTTLFDSGLISKKMIVDNSRKFIDYAKKKLSSNKENIETNGHNYYDCVQILGIINTPESNSLLARFAKFDNRGLRYQTLVAQLRNNQRVDSRTIYTMATTVEYRYDLYEELRKLKKQSLFPADYLSQEKLAYSKLYKDYHEDDEYSVAFKSAGTKTILYKGKQQKVYIYKALETEDYDYSLNDKDRTYYLAIAGPYSLNAKDYSSNHELTGIYWEKKYDEGKLDELIREYLESLEETTEEEIPPPPPQKAVK